MIYLWWAFSFLVACGRSTPVHDDVTPTVEEKAITFESHNLVSPLCIVKNASQTTNWAQVMKEPVGCVSEILVSSEKGLPVEFKDEDASQQPSLCWETCRTVVNASLALLAENNGQLKCFCGNADSVTSKLTGPDVFCHRQCQSDKGDFHCGGEHKFSEKTTLQYYSIYCLAFANKTSGDPIDPNLPHNNPITSTTEANTTPDNNGTHPAADHIQDVLDKMLVTMMNTNMLFIFIVFLLIIVLLLVMVTCCWAWGCVRKLDPDATAEVYRQMMGPRTNPHAPIKSRANHSTASYGTSNEAFQMTPDLDPELNPPQPSPMTPAKPFQRNTSSSPSETETELATPNNGPTDMVYKMGKSKFYRSREDGLDTDEAFEDASSIATASTVTAADNSSPETITPEEGSDIIDTIMRDKKAYK